jgi:type IV pilus assembly protein PilY1
MNPSLFRRRIVRPSLVAAGAALAFAAGVGAAPLDLSRVPLIVNTSVPPNIMVTLDDSGSMGWGFLPDGANFGTGDCRYYDSTINRIYFDPAADYPPPLRPDGTPFPNANYTAAWWDGFSTGQGTSDLRTAYRVSNDHQGAAPPYDSGWRTSGFPAGVASGGNQRAFYCSGGVVRLIQDEPALWPKFANWFSYYRIRSLSARTALSTAFARLDPSARVAWQNYNSNQLAAGTAIRELDLPAWRTSFFNWLHAPRFSGNTPMLTAFNRAGQFFERGGTGTTNPYWDVARNRELSCRQNFQVFTTDGYWNVTLGGSIGNADAQGVGMPSTAPDPTTIGGAEARVFWNVAAGGTAAPNLADLAMYYWRRDLRGTLENNVPSYLRNQTIVPIAGATTEDREIFFNPANDPADWQRLVNFMITFGAGGTIPFDNTIPGQTQADRLLELRQGTRQWPAATSGNGTTIDDTWHAAVNSRGDFLSANNPQELVDALTSVLDSISNRNGVGGAAAASSTVLNTDRTQRFVGTYDTRGWSGDLIAYNVLPNGNICPDGSLDCPGLSVWRAQPQLNTRNPDDRVLMTSNSPTGGGVGFRWAQLSPQQQAWLNINPETGVADGLGEQRVNFLRGDRSEEQSNGGALRNRNHVMGAVVESNTVYVSAPSAGYTYTSAFPEGGSYANFVANNRNRRSAVYVGANDGMLHAFDAGIPDDPNTGANEAQPGTGRELFAYLPYEVARNLNRLTDPNFSFVPTVDGTPVVKDVYIGGQWRTVLLSNLRGGGQGAFALDITDPVVSETDAASRVLWEFSDNYPLGDASRLGYTYGRPNFARLDDGTWVAVIPGGYNNESTIDYATRFLPNAGTDPVAGNGRASLFIVNLASGALIREVVLPTTANGLAEPVIGDYEGDFVDDVAIMGDIVGNVWRVDLANWAVDRLFQPAVANNRPITARPRLFPDPITQGFTVVVGTGKFVEQGDRTTALPQRQVIMGVRDLGRNSPRYPAQLTNMIQQTFSGLDGNGFFQMAAPQEVLPSHGGWYIQIGNSGLDARLAGERVIDAAQAYFQPGFALFESFIPTDDPCQTRSVGALYAFAASDGAWTIPGGGAAAALAAGGISGGGVGGGQNAFDTSGDGRVDASDQANAVGKIDFNRPPNLSSSLASPGGGQINVGGASLPSPVWRRRGWREIDE